MGVANAAIVWQWEHRVDHDPVVTDLTCYTSLPGPVDKSGNKPWRELLHDMGHPEAMERLRATVAEVMRPQQQRISKATAVLRAIRARAPSPWCAYGNLAPWQACTPVPLQSDRESINWAADAIEGSMLAAVPWPARRAGPSRRVRTAAGTMQLAIDKLHVIRNRIKYGRAVLRVHLNAASAAWSRAIHASTQLWGQPAATRQHPDIFSTGVRISAQLSGGVSRWDSMAPTC